MAETETVNVRGTGGAEFTLDLPLSEVMAEQVYKGQLTAVDEESEELLAPYTEDPDATAKEPEADPDALPPRTGKGSGKKAWLAYAEAQGFEVDPDLEYAELQDAIEAAAAEEG
jgi:hypothetical protein